MVVCAWLDASSGWAAAYVWRSCWTLPQIPQTVPGGLVHFEQVAYMQCHHHQQRRQQEQHNVPQVVETSDAICSFNDPVLGCRYGCSGEGPGIHPCQQPFGGWAAQHAQHAGRGCSYGELQGSVTFDLYTLLACSGLQGFVV